MFAGGLNEKSLSQTMAILLFFDVAKFFLLDYLPFSLSGLTCIQDVIALPFSSLALYFFVVSFNSLLFGVFS